MDFYDQIINYFKKPESETKDTTPEGVCPVCWGYQEYDHEIRTIFKDDQIDVINNRKKYTQTKRFLKEKIEGIRLKEGEVEECPECGEKHDH